jgi:hypothetical protein
LFTGGQYQNCPLGAASNVCSETTQSRTAERRKEQYEINPSIFGQGPPGEAQQMEEKKS